MIVVGLLIIKNIQKYNLMSDMLLPSYNYTQFDAVS